MFLRVVMLDWGGGWFAGGLGDGDGPRRHRAEKVWRKNSQAEDPRCSILDSAFALRVTLCVCGYG